VARTSQITLITVHRVLRLSAALKRLVLPALQPATIHRSGSYGIRPCHKCLIYGRPLPACAGQTTSRKRPLDRLEVALCSCLWTTNGHLHHLCPAPLLTPDDAVLQRCLTFSCATASVRLAVLLAAFRPEPERFFPCTVLAPFLQSGMQPCDHTLLCNFSACHSDLFGFHHQGAGPFRL